MRSCVRALLVALLVLTVSAAKDATDVLEAKIEAKAADLFERLKTVLQVPKDEISLAQTADTASSHEDLPLAGEESLGDVYYRGQLHAQEEAKKQQEATMQKRAQEAALAAAQQQAYMDAIAFQQQAILLQQAARAHRHRHRRHRRQHRRRRAHKAASAPSFFQQYYGVQPTGDALGAYAVAPPGSAPSQQQPLQQQLPAAPQAPQPAAQSPNLLEMPPAQPPAAQSAPAAPSKPVLSYGDPFNGARFQEQRAAPATRIAGSAYGMPQEAPVSEAVSLMSNAVAAMAQPAMSAAQLNMNKRIAAPMLPRFREGMAQTATVGDKGNPNPSGVPMPFYSPNQAPPPAPNQLPSSSAAVRGVFPFEMQQATSVGVRPAMGAQAGLNTAAINFSPLGVHADINAYPFNSFLELEHVVTMPRRQVPKRKYTITHPGLYKLAKDPLRASRIEPLTDEHVEAFPLLSQ